MKHVCQSIPDARLLVVGAPAYAALYYDDVRYISDDITGSLWFGMGRGYEPQYSWATRHRPSRFPPNTHLTFTPGSELPTGSLIVEWSGLDAWKDTPVEKLRYSWKMDNGTWSDLSPTIKQVYVDLSTGNHTFQVRAVDSDGNLDPTPAIYDFYVIPPVWRIKDLK